jgi:hypothetical protein
MMKRLRILLALPLCVCACAYDPPVQANHQSASYQADLKQRRKTGDEQATKIVKASGILFLTYPVSYPVKARAQIRKCMQDKGYNLEK